MSKFRTAESRARYTSAVQPKRSRHGVSVGRPQRLFSSVACWLVCSWLSRASELSNVPVDATALWTTRASMVKSIRDAGVDDIAT
jgi:hypothetical protein